MDQLTGFPIIEPQTMDGAHTYHNGTDRQQTTYNSSVVLLLLPYSVSNSGLTIIYLWQPQHLIGITQTWDWHDPKVLGRFSGGQAVLPPATSVWRDPITHLRGPFIAQTTPTHRALDTPAATVVSHQHTCSAPYWHDITTQQPNITHHGYTPLVSPWLVCFWRIARMTAYYNLQFPTTNLVRYGYPSGVCGWNNHYPRPAGWHGTIVLPPAFGGH